MKKELALYAAFVSLVAPLLTGCICTNCAGGRIGTPYYDTFNPSAVYRRENPVGFALEGTMEKKGKSSRAFLIVPDELLVRAHAQTNRTLSLGDIQRAFDPLVSLGEVTHRSLPRVYTKVAVLPTNTIKLDMGRRESGGGWGYLIPFAFIADVATFPFQVIYVAAGGDPGWRF